MARFAVAFLALLPLLASAACAATTEEDDADQSEDHLVATFDRVGQIDVSKRSRILLVGDSDELGELPLYSATTKARRLAQLYPTDQIVLFVTKDVRDSTVTGTGTTIVKQNPFGNVALADLRTLTSTKLIAALDRFTKIASLEFFGHSSPFGPLLENDTADRVLDPSGLSVLKDNFDRSTNPYVTLNGCNGGNSVAGQLSKMWELPVTGALTASNFEVLMSDGRWYPNDVGFFPPNLTRATKNDKSYGAALTPSCSTGACTRMKPQDSPYWGVWSDQDTGFQFGLNYYKAFCDYPDAGGTCAKGLATMLYAFPSTRTIDKNSSDADFAEVLADFLCDTSKDAAWFDQCKTNLFAAAASGTAFSPMKNGNDYSLECDFAKCQQKFRCKTVNGVPQKKTCAWVDASCRDDQRLSSCKSKNPTKQTTNHEVAKYLEGHRALRGH